MQLIHSGYTFIDSSPREPQGNSIASRTPSPPEPSNDFGIDRELIQSTIDQVGKVLLL